MEGFSQDGYIIDQDQFEEYLYRGMPSKRNGCGWIAAYNFRKAMGQELSFEDVLQEMNDMYRVKVPGPTPVRILRQYLRRYISCRYTPGRPAALVVARKSHAGILRYCEGPIPHFVSFVRADDTHFRFFNVADGMEEITETMDDFFKGHCSRGFVRVVTG